MFNIAYKIIKVCGVTGQFSMMHGSFMDEEVVRRAVNTSL